MLLMIKAMEFFFKRNKFLLDSTIQIRIRSSLKFFNDYITFCINKIFKFLSI